MEAQQKKLNTAQKDMVLNALCQLVANQRDTGRSLQDTAKDLIEAARLINEA